MDPILYVFTSFFFSFSLNISLCPRLYIVYTYASTNPPLRSLRSCIYNCRTVYHIVNALNCIVDQVHESMATGGSGRPSSSGRLWAFPSRSTRDVTPNALGCALHALGPASLTSNSLVMHKSSRKIDGEVKVHSGLKYPHRLSLWGAFLLCSPAAHDVRSQIQI